MTARLPFLTPSTLAFLCLAVAPASATRWPTDGAILTHSQVLFEVDPIPGADGYVVQVGEADRAEPFKNPVAEHRTTTLTVRAERFRFDREYTWRYAALDAAGHPGAFSTAFSFTIPTSPTIDRERFRFRVRGKETPPGVFLLDHAGVAVDGTGRPIWYLPPNEEVYPDANPGRIRDLKISPAGTLTLLSSGDAIEIDLDGTLRWRAPRKDSPVPGRRGGFHHDFKRLRNGRYMVLEQEPVTRDVPGQTEPRTYNYDSIVEYDDQGEVTWAWHARDYVSDVDLFSGEGRGMHMNCFEVDPEGRFVLGGFRDLSRIVKIDRRRRKVVDSWGQRFPSGDARAGDDFFRHQHDCLLLDDGSILVFNNNDVRDREAPSGLVLFDPGSRGSRPKVLWRWDVPKRAGSARKAVAGGNVAILPKERYLVHMGAVNQVFLLSRDGAIRWEALIEHRTPLEEDAPSSTSPAADQGEESLRELPYLAGGSWEASTAGAQTGGKWASFPQYRVSWSSSLWPIWFTIEFRSEKSGRVRIYNEGSEPDSYTVVAPGQSARTTETVAPGAFVEVDLSSSVAKVEVRSAADPRRVRSLPAQSGPRLSNPSSTLKPRQTVPTTRRSP